MSITCFDWDDTLLPSSYIFSKKYDAVVPSLKELENAVCNLLSLALQHSDVIIVTNSESGWVILSAKRYIPKVVPLLQKCGVISARSSYEKLFPAEPVKWKYEAFKTILTSTTQTIISMGDSHCEREAVRNATKDSHVIVKSVKFANNPNIKHLQKQLETVIMYYDYIRSHNGALDLMLTIA